MQYRVLESLRYYETNRRLEAGTISDLKKLSPETIALLLAKQRIAEVHPPPLVVLPGWEEKAKVYAEQGIETVNDMTGEEEDFSEALAWSMPSEDEDDFMTTPLSEDIYEVTEDDIASPLPSGEGMDNELED
jgi:hypothetical protein